MTEPVFSGTLEDLGALPLLQEIETRRTTGILRVKASSLEVDILLFAGQLSEDQIELSEGRDPVEELLALRRGTFEVFQRMPPLAGCQGNDQARHGSLSARPPGELMAFCERMGLTG
ncbi:MAG: DUF4388 domain-containing protein, partial [Myxococcales bacterium]|nr:DUF4388 domain-containing protein [Myxococcales bacterium]